MRTYLLSICTFIALILPIFSKAQQGAIDPTFNPTDNGFGYGDGANGIVYTSAVQADGKIIVGGTFTNFNGTTKNNVARLNADGSNDLTFNSGAGANGEVWTCAVQSDGKIIIGGNFTSYNGTARTRIARINTDGTIDLTFNPGTGANNDIETVSIQSDGKIIIGGQFTNYNGTAINRIARIDANGAIDPTFVIGTGSDNIVYTSVIQSDGKIIIGGSFTNVNGVARTRVARINTDGSTDVSFTTGSGANNIVFTSAIQSDGKIIIGGAFTTYSATASNRITRLNTNGTPDVTFTIGTGANNNLQDLKIQSDGKIIITGDFTAFNGTTINRLARLNTNGSLDVTYSIGSGPTVSTGGNGVYACALQADDKAIIGGAFTSYNGSARTRIARINTDGSVDATFGYCHGANGIIRTVFIQPNGKIAFGGDFGTYSGSLRSCITRANNDGATDIGFNPGIGTNGGIVRTISMQSTDKLIIGGDFTSYNSGASTRLARAQTNGASDAVSFPTPTGANNIIYSSVVQTDDKIIIAGVFTAYGGTARNHIARVLTNANNDATFNPGTGTDGNIHTCALQSDGNIIIGGSFTNYNGTARSNIARITTTGTLDATFNPGTGTDGIIYSCYVQSDGKIVIAGNFTTYNGTARNNIARLNADGSLDATFNPGTGANNIIYTTCGQIDGKVIIGGNFTSYNGTARNYFARLNSNGTLDLTFNIGTGANNTIYTSAIQSDGHIIIGGAFTSYDGIGRNRAARIIGECIVPSVTSTTAAAICGTGTVVLGATASSGTLNWYATPTSTLSLGTGTSFTTPSISSNTTYYVEAFNGCTSATRTAVTATVNPTPTITVNSGAICTGQSFTITPGGASTYTIQGGSAVKTPTTNATYTVTGTSAAGCISSTFATASVTVNARPVITANSGSMCSGNSFTITPGGASTYTIQGGSAVVSPTANTSYTVVGTSTAGCVSSTFATANVTVNATPTISVNSGSICSGNNFTITPGGASTYTIQGGSAVKTPTSNATYTVTGTSAAGCVASTFATSSVTVNTTPTISVNSGSICIGNSFTITPSGANTYTFQGGSAVKTPTANASYTVTGTSTAGCPSSTFAVSSVTVNSRPVISVNSGSICAGNSFTINPGGASTYTIQGGSAVVNPTATASYTVVGTNTAGCISNTFATSNVTVSSLPIISVNSGSICSGNSFTITPSGASTYTIEGGSSIKTPTASTSYTVIGTSAAGCVSGAFATSSITVNTRPIITVNSGSICSGNSFTINPAGANTYTIQGGSAVVSPTATTNYTVVGTSAAGCVSNTFATSNVTVSTTPTITVNSGSICSGNSFTINPAGANTYTIQGGNAVVSPTATASYTVVGTSAAGCVSNTFATSNVTVNALPTISLSGGAICPGNSFTLSPGGANTYTYSSGSAVVSPTITTSYSVSGTSAAGCISSSPAIATVTVANTLTVSITGANTICEGQSANLTAGGATSYTWNTGATSSIIAPAPTTNTTYSVIGASGSCSNTAVITITVNPLPTINTATTHTLLCAGETASLTASGSSISYTWNPGGTGASIAVTPALTTNYSVTGTDANGCENTSVITQSVSACTGIDQIAGNGHTITLFPNPASASVTVKTDDAIQIISIYTPLGKLVQTETENSFSVEQLASGIYLVKVQTEKGTVTIRFIKE